MPAASLDTYLSRFYAELQKYGSFYMKSAIIIYYVIRPIRFNFVLIVYIACMHFEMRYNKTNRDWRYRSLLEIVSPQLGKY